MNVLFIVDTYDWSFIRCSQGIIKGLPSGWTCRVTTNPLQEDLDWADRIKCFSWSHVRGPLEKAVVGICSWNQIHTARGGRGDVVLQNARAVYAVNEELRFHAEQQLGREVLRRRHLVDTDVFMPDEDTPLPDKLVIGFCGNAPRQEKRFYLVEATVAALGCEFRGMGVGLENKTADSLEMSKFYSGLTCLMSCSSSEGTPQPPLEAMACGCPVIASPVGHMLEIIRPGLNGFLCFDVREFIASALHCHAHRTEMFQWAHKTAKQHDWIRDAAQWTSIIGD